MLRRLVPLLLVLCLAVPAAAARRRAPLTSEQRIEEACVRLLGRALTNDRAWEDLVHLRDRIGHRLSGSEPLDRAIAWAAGRLEEAGFDVVLEPVMVPRWVRGAERATLLAPVERRLPLLGLGMTVGTPVSLSTRARMWR